MAAAAAHKRVDIKRNDTVKVMTGKDQGKEGRVLRVFPGDGKLLVEHVMMVKSTCAPIRSATSRAALRSRKAGSTFRTCNWFVPAAARSASATSIRANARCAFARSAAIR